MDRRLTLDTCRRYHRAWWILIPGWFWVLSGCTQPTPPLAGVSWELAQQRKQRISELEYRLHLRIPEDHKDSIQGIQRISFEHRQTSPPTGPLALDFAPGAGHVKSLRLSGSEAAWSAANGHLMVPGLPDSGRVEIEIEFEAGDASLNRREDYLYALFVPDRASEAIPCFDQPDLKASFQLELDLPQDWAALSNGEVVRESEKGGRRILSFSPTQPISTYLFTFVAGRFWLEEGEFEGRRMRFLHRETDLEKVQRNREALFQLHGQALRWMEEYTQQEYPFDKFDFVLLPGFQFGGMEHPGSVFYRAERLLLDPSPTRNEVLGRASLIAHETAHMWFGDLVTMRWFDDVWTKEVFANFMAAKITHPQFPETDHNLRFFLGHHPSAYAVDRSAGTHPIRQPLENLNEAASLYGAIIYQKAPVVMRQLELLIGEDSMRDGLRRYLQDFAFDNARWTDLVDILDQASELDLRRWSQVWVESAGRPHIDLTREESGDGRKYVKLRQHDPSGQGRLWLQPLRPLLWSPRGSRRLLINMVEHEVTLGWIIAVPSVVLPNAGGIGYGLFQLPAADQERLLQELGKLPQALDRAVAWETLWDAVLERRLAPVAFLDALLDQLPREREELVISRMLYLIGQSYWGLHSPAQRLEKAAAVEAVLWRSLRSARTDSLRLLLFRGLRNVALTPEAVARVRAIWEGAARIRGLHLSPTDQIETVLELAVRDGVEVEPLVAEQLQRLHDRPYLREQFRFVSEAVSPDPSQRRAFFESLRDIQRRSREPWVLQAVRYLHHPLRAPQSERLILPALVMLEEIQRTGDIFFPKRWLDATLEGHQTRTAAQTVRRFLAARPDYPRRLRGKILQSADLLFRRARILGPER